MFFITIRKRCNFQCFHALVVYSYWSNVMLPKFDYWCDDVKICCLYSDTVYPKKYAHGFCFAVLCCGYTLTDFPISIRLTSLALWQSSDCPSARKATLMNMDKYFMWIHYERLHNHNKAKHNKTVCIVLGIYCTGRQRTIKYVWIIWSHISYYLLVSWHLWILVMTKWSVLYRRTHLTMSMFVRSRICNFRYTCLCVYDVWIKRYDILSIPLHLFHFMLQIAVLIIKMKP